MPRRYRRSTTSATSTMPTTPKTMVSAVPSRISQTTSLAAVRRGPVSRARPLPNAARFCSSPSTVFGLAVRPQAPSTYGEAQAGSPLVAVVVESLVGPHRSQGRSRYRLAMPSPAVEIEVGARTVRISNPDRVYFSDARRDQARPRQLLPVGRRRHRAGAARAAVHAAPLPRGRRRREDLPEAAAQGRARLGRDGRGQLPVRTHRRRAVRHRARRRRLGGADVDGRVPPVAHPPGRRRAAGRAAHRPRSAARAPASPRRKQVAAVVHEVLDELGAVGWPKTSGSKGVHVYVRIEPRFGFREVRRAALAFAREVERRAPALVTTTGGRRSADGAIFLDYNQNAQGPHDRRGLLGARQAVRAGVGAGDLGRAARRRDARLHHRDDAGAVRVARRPARRHRRRGVGHRAAARVGRARRARPRPRRRAVPAELPEDGRASRRACSRRG